VRTLVRRSQEAARASLENQKSLTSTPRDDDGRSEEGEIALSRATVVIAADDMKWKKELPKWTVIVQGKTLPLRPLARQVAQLAPHQRVSTGKTVEMFKKLGFQVLYEGKPV
jgi:hypothetical protein